MVILAVFLRTGAAEEPSVRSLVDAAAQASGVPVDVSVFDLDESRENARRLRIRHAPCVAVLTDEGDTGIRFYGTAKGFAIQALSAIVRLAGRADAGLPDPGRMRLRELADPEHIRLFVDLEDASALTLAKSVAQVACGSELIWCDILDARAFAALGKALGAGPAPTILAGMQPLELPACGTDLADAILRARCWIPGPESAPFRTAG
jgi:hypothetical protein